MTPVETKQVLAEMTATWPQRGMSPPEVGVWCSNLKPLRASTAITAVRELRTVCDWLPTHNQFMAAYQAVARREALERPAIPESTSRVAKPAYALGAIAEARAKLKTPQGRATADVFDAIGDQP